MRRLGLLAVAASTAGCDLVFELDEPSRCSAISMFADDFRRNELSTNWRFFNGSQFTPPMLNLDDNRLLITGNNSEGGGVMSPVYYDLREAGLSVDVELVGGGLLNRDGSVAAFDLVSTIEDDRELSDQLRMLVRGDQLIAERYAGGTPFLVGMIPYDEVEHRRWRIARSGTSVTWSVASADGEFRTIQEFKNLPITHVRPQLSIVCGTAGCSATFDNVTDGGTERGAACSVNGQRDDFATDTIDYTRWHPFEGLCSWTQANGQLRGDYDPNATSVCFFETSTILDATAGAFGVEIVDQGTVDVVVLQAFAFDDHEIRFERSGGMLIARDGAPNQLNFEAKAFDPSAHRWWRFRGNPDTGLMVFEVSADGNDWKFFAQTGNLGTLDRTRFRIGIGGAAPGTVVFDNVNLTP